MSSTPPPLPPLNPYAAPTARVTDIVDDEYTLADRGIRLAAAIVDGLLFGGVAILMAVVVPAMAGRNGHVDQTILAVVAIVFIGGMLAVAVINMVLLHRHGQTIAKRWFKIKIVRSDGSRCGLLRVIFARALPVGLLGVIPFIGSFISLMDALLIFRADYRCLHDHIADTIVVKA